MVKVRKYLLPPTGLMPNSPYPLIHYRGLISADSNSIATKFYDLLGSNGWRPQWIYRYGQTQKAHYHSAVHECMVVLTGTATIRFGAADTTDDMHENTYGKGREEGGIELQAQAGDVFVIPAGVSHKTFNPKPFGDFKLLTPGDGHGLPADIRLKLDQIELSGFTMMGSYPEGTEDWDFAVGGEGAAAFAKVWAVPPPRLDPMLGNSKEGLCTIWGNQPSKLHGRL
ncbi:hypothetical protein GQ53DRAFT_728326 [Thozetella sp. PMI_491]|nr:hypothetical protein GQ53DRAFT_728326 [Thozetella sp. PMI_491]